MNSFPLIGQKISRGPDELSLGIRGWVALSLSFLFVIAFLLVLRDPNPTELDLQRWYFRQWIDSGGTPYTDLHGEIPSKRGTFLGFRLF